MKKGILDMLWPSLCELRPDSVPSIVTGVKAADGVRSPREWRSFLQQMPKIDLHRHLEGSLRLQTLAEIAEEHGIDLPSYRTEDLRRYVQVQEEEPDYHRFLAKFRLLRRFYQSREAVERVATEVVADAAADNVRYLELRFNPIALSRAQRFPLRDVVEWVTRAIARAQQTYSVTVRLIMQIGRDEIPRLAEEMLELALAYRDQGVVGMDLAGDEVNYPAYRIAHVFWRARQEGLGVTIHAGEVGGAANVRDAILRFHAQRIGHGIQALENSEVVRLIQERGIALEVCPTSNLQTGAVRSLSHHPLPDMLALGLRATLNTDDPSISDTTLTDEYLIAVTTLGLGIDHIRAMVFHALDAAFLPEEERASLRKQFEPWSAVSLPELL
ncbi:MAG: adenosine deaminase [Anaerolineae bacterium]|nr:adenosine deaminase [Anaerolineae bacterium]MDW8068432.1 adenosine deaminase [Anaerolineae bacterium]